MAGLIAVAVLAYTVFVWTAPLVALTFRCSDDSYYYFQVARNVVQGYGLTFDRIHPTNGFHPLWMLCVIPVYALTGGAGESSLRLVLTLVAAIAGATFWVAYRCVSEYASRAAGALALLALASPPFVNPMINGLETGFLLFLLFVLLWAGRRLDLLSPQAGAGKNALLGFLLGLVLLARLDSAFVVICVVAALTWRGLRESGEERPLPALARKLVTVAGAMSVVVLPYFAWDLLTFGHLVPISGALKTSFPEVTFNLRRFQGYHAHYGQVQLLLSTSILAALFFAKRRGGRDREEGALGARSTVLVATWAGAVLHFLNTLLFMDFGVHWWHFASYAPMTLVFLGLGFERLRVRVLPPRRLAVGAIAAVAAVVAVAWAADFLRRGVDHERWFEAALWARRNLPANAVVGMTDCGLFGYFSERRTVNLDGVINGYEYQDALSACRLREFLGRSRMTHLAAHAVRYENGRYVVWLPARLDRGPGGAIVGVPSAEIYRSPEYAGVRFVIWDLSRLAVFDDARVLVSRSPAARSIKAPRVGA